MDGKANLGERSINTVTDNKPKMLEGLSQNGNVAGTRARLSLVMGNNCVYPDYGILGLP